MHAFEMDSACLLAKFRSVGVNLPPTRLKLILWGSYTTGFFIFERGGYFKDWIGKESYIRGDFVYEGVL